MVGDHRGTAEVDFDVRDRRVKLSENLRLRPVGTVILNRPLTVAITHSRTIEDNRPYQSPFVIFGY